MIVRYKILIALLLVVCFATSLQHVSGHGVGYETLPPQFLDKRKVAMEVLPNTDNSTGKRQITFSMFDVDTGVTVRDAKYQLTATKNNHVLFDVIHETSNGVLTLDLIPDDSKKITTTTKSDDGLFGSLLGPAKNILEARGDVFKTGGLYSFSIRVIEAENYSGKSKPVLFEAGISFPEYTIIEIQDEHFGLQRITQVSYYDVLTQLRYDAKTNSITFSMPFEWTDSNINQTSVIHQEIIIPKTFGTLQVSEYAATVNGLPISDQSITVDDFAEDNRTIHLLLYQSELLRLYETQKGLDKIDFVLFPKSDDIVLVGTTENVQYKIAVTGTPQRIRAGDHVSLMFQVYDIFLSGKTVSTSYDLMIESNGKKLYATSGKSSAEKSTWSEIKLTIPNDASDKLVLHFENLGGNKLARAQIPIVLGLQNTIPPWIKNNAEWWCKNSISDDDFLRGIGYLVNKNVIKVSKAQDVGGTKQIPDWVRSNACWWSDGAISDNEFVNAIAFLVKTGLITP